MNWPAVILGLGLILVAMVDALESIVMPRTVKRSLRLSTLMFELSSRGYALTRFLPKGPIRNSVLNAYAPVTLLSLISFWALSIVFGFALLVWGVHPVMTNQVEIGFPSSLYYSGVTFFTLGFGDLTPQDGLGRFLAVSEAGLGFGFLALLIGYVPVMYTSFSRREVAMLLLDSKAGSDPSATTMLVRHAELGCMDKLEEVLKQWEQTSAELLESMLSYPILAYYRSQHDDSSWLKSLTAVLDCCVLIEHVMVGDEPWMRGLRYQARNTFAMGRHVLVDVAYILDEAPTQDNGTRLRAGETEFLVSLLHAAGLKTVDVVAADSELQKGRITYEPFARSLAKELRVDLPVWSQREYKPDNWQTSAWEGVRHF